MNGISPLIPEIAAGITAGVLLIINGIIFFKVILPTYSSSFKDTSENI